MRQKFRFISTLTIRTANDLSTIQFRLIFKGHKSLEYCCFVIHLTSVSSIFYAESNGSNFNLIAPFIRHYKSLNRTISKLYSLDKRTASDLSVSML